MTMDQMITGFHCLSINYINGLVQDCNDFSALAMELLQFCVSRQYIFTLVPLFNELFLIIQS